MSAPEVVVLRTGAANLASVIAGLTRSGVGARLTVEPVEIATAEAVILPGVGAFGPVARRLAGSGAGTALAARIESGLPTMAICLGMHLLSAGSDESPEVAGLGVLSIRATRYSDLVRVPQLGWNRVEADGGCSLLSHGDAYFANSFRFTEAPPGWRAAWSDHDGPFVAGVERGPVLACQFHPELSGRWGQALIRRWLETAGVL